MLMIIAILALLILAVLGLAATRPDSFRVERGLIMQATPEKVYTLISNFHLWGTWSPWERMDPTMMRTHSGAQSGQGAVYEWQGNNKVGKGRMEIIEATAPSRVTIKLDFLKPFEAHNTAEFTLTVSGAATYVVWAMHGPSPYIAKLMGLFFSMDKMIGKDFETGLANMRSVAEK